MIAAAVFIVSKLEIQEGLSSISLRPRLVVRACHHDNTHASSFTCWRQQGLPFILLVNTLIKSLVVRLIIIITWWANPNPKLIITPLLCTPTLQCTGRLSMHWCCTSCLEHHATQKRMCTTQNFSGSYFAKADGEKTTPNNA